MTNINKKVADELLTERNSRLNECVSNGTPLPTAYWFQVACEEREAKYKLTEFFTEQINKLIREIEGED